LAKTTFCGTLLIVGKIDGVKELLNSLRVAMNIAFGILVILIRNIVKRYDAEKIDILFWFSMVFVEFL